MPSKDNNENCFMHPKVDNREIIIWNDTDEFIETLQILILNGKTNLFNENKFSYLPEKFLRLVWKTNLLKQKKIIHFFKERTNLMICVFPLFKKNFSYTQPTFVFFIFWEIFISFASIFLLFFLLVFLRKISIPFTSSFCSLSLFFGNI